jgi:LuxR family transcriptional regulator, maltose regulon positive regulatory protein
MDYHLSMGTPGTAPDAVILRAKLAAPRMPESYVARRRLAGLLEPMRPVTLVCAPAGFGKTVAVCEWLGPGALPVAWLSLDEGDNDAARFFLHLVAALQQIAPDCGGALLRAAGSLGDTDVPVLVGALANQLHEVKDLFVVVLDDYHLVRSTIVHDAVGFLVEHMPRSMRLVLTSRREPPLALPRWRMRQMLAELGQEQLRFTGAEAASFLEDVMGLELTAAQAARLEQRTEGWIGGLQLAALSLGRQPDRDAFLDRFAGDDRYVMDYLTAEVLAGQPDEVRRFLVRTSVLERMSAPLCEAVTGIAGCGDILDRLERERLFVISLDSTREWYRYHHLFQSLLLHQLAASETERAGDCHLAASIWHERNGSIADAAHHAVQAGLDDRVGELIEAHGWHLSRAGRAKQVLGWIRAIPEAVTLANPERALAAMWCEYMRTGVVREDWRRRIEPAGAVRLGLFDILEAARDPDRYPDAIERARALAERAPSDELVQLMAGTIVAACSHALGHGRAAREHYRRSIERALATGYPSALMFLGLGEVRLIAAQDGPRAGLRRADELLALAATRGWDSLPVAALLLHGRGAMLWACGNRDASEAVWERALTLGENEPSTGRHLVTVALARLHLGRGRADQCDALLAAIEREPYIQALMPVVPDLDLERAWLELDRGRVDAVQAILERRGFGTPEVGDALAIVHGQSEAGPLLVGRYLLARNQHERAVAVLTGALDAALAAGYHDTVLRCRVDLAVARLHLGDRHEALHQLDAALDLIRDRAGGDSAPERSVFSHAPVGLPAIIRRRLDGPVLEPWRRQLLEGLLAGLDGTAEPTAGRPRPAEPLSPSEARVLERLIAGLTNREIAKELFISPNTLKTHIRRIYAKLGARTRAEAIRQAQILGLLRGS